MRKIRFMAAVLACLAIFSAAAFAQNITGALTGTVVDPAGAVVPSAQVVLTNQQTQAKQTTTSNDSGIFLFPSLLPGTYTVEVSIAGFNARTR